MTPRIPVTFANINEWVRLCATALNRLIAQREADMPFPFMMAVDEPADPAEGQGYYSTTLHKARIWDGTTWNDLW